MLKICAPFFFLSPPLVLALVAVFAEVLGISSDDEELLDFLVDLVVFALVLEAAALVGTFAMLE